MKFVLSFTALLAVASAQFTGFKQFTSPPPKYVRPTTAAPRLAAAVVNRVVSSDQAANILRFDNDISPDGAYNYVVETDNGIAIQAQGTPRDFGGNPPVKPVVSQGSYAYTARDGEPIAISYIADENGYQPTGNAIPTPHPIPEAILRSLDFLAKNAPKK